MIIRRASGWKGLQLPVKQTEDTGNWQNTEEDSDFKLINCAAFWLRSFFFLILLTLVLVPGIIIIY